MKCPACNSEINDNDQRLRCTTCSELYHLMCLNIGMSRYMAHKDEYMNSWRCPHCVSNINTAARGTRTNDTPVRRTLGVDDTDMSCDNITLDDTDIHAASDTTISTSVCPLTLEQVSALLDSKLDKLINYMKTEMHTVVTQFRGEITQSIVKVKEEQKIIKDGLSSVNLKISIIESQCAETSQVSKLLCESVDFISNSQKDFQKTYKNIPDEVTDLKTQVTTLVNKIETMEQQARMCNLEISNLPEEKSENLIGVVKQLGAFIKIQIAATDIVSVHRVPHPQSEYSRPKNIVVRLTSRTLRDNIVSACRMAKGLKSDLLSVAGPPVPVYVNEHLTLFNKKLFRLCRDAAKQHNYKYVWIKHGKVLVRESDASPAIVIRTPDDVQRRIHGGQP